MRFSRFAALAVLCALGLSVRLNLLGESELGVDEAFSWRLTGYPTGEVIDRTALDVHPPLYYLLLKGWVAVWGDSPHGLRGLSVLFGVLSVVLAFLVSREACGHKGGNRGGALLAAFLVATHVQQIVPSRTARMYALGILLVALTTWLLLRACRAEAGSTKWWAGYGIAAAAFVYTHNYALFSLLAQGLFVIGLWVSQTVRPDRLQTTPGQLARGCALAAGIAALLYSPWLPSIGQQVRAVKSNYWIEGPTWNTVSGTMTTWATGLVMADTWGLSLALVLITLAFVWTIRRGGAGAWLLLSLAFVPWICALSISLLSGRPILLDRCLGFAQFGYLCLWGVLWDRVGGWPTRCAITILLGVGCLVGLCEFNGRLPTGQPAIARAAEYLRAHSRPGDVVEVGGAPAVNRMRYYLSRNGTQWVVVQSQVSWFNRSGHVDHQFALSEADMAFPEVSKQPGSPKGRVWYGSDGDGGPILESRPPLNHAEFSAANGGRYRLTLYGEE